MWTRAEIKTRAKAVLRNNYWRAFLVSLVLLAAGAGYSNWGGGSSHGSSNNRAGEHYSSAGNAGGQVEAIWENVAQNVKIYGDSEVIATYVYRMDTDTTPFAGFRNFSPLSWLPGIFWMVLGIGIALLAVFAVLFRVFAGYGLEVGGRRYFINAADNPKTGLKILGLAFKSPIYFNVLSIMFLRSLFTFLWSLLFIIPGIVKGFEYSMVPYILADNPTMSSKRAFELSKEMTNGHKWDMFVLNLSFIGWYILGSLFFGIGVLFVYPYENATKAELYIKLRDNVINSGFVGCDELNLYPVYDYIDITDQSNN